jgi:hypothetical protein
MFGEPVTLPFQAHSDTSRKAADGNHPESIAFKIVIADVLQGISVPPSQEFSKKFS